MKHLDPEYVERVHAFDRVYQARRENVNDDGSNAKHVTRQQHLQERHCAYERCCHGASDDDMVKQRLKRCGQCKAVYYCSTSCQNLDWKAGHRNACRPPLLRKSEKQHSDDLPPGSVVFHDKECMIELISDDGSRIRVRAMDKQQYENMVSKTSDTFSSFNRRETM